ncbi:MAG: trans-sulfuration enzyme family protein [Alphaproteobacteria bacterium]
MVKYSKDNFRLGTKLTLMGRDSKKHDGIINPPPYRASTILHESLDHLLGIKKQKITYGRHGTATADYLRAALTELEEGYDTMLASSGMNAITTLFLSVASVKKNAVMLVADNVYDPVKNFLQKMITPLGVLVVYFDPMDTKTLSQKIIEYEKNLVLVWIENPGSQTFEICDTQAIVAMARAKNILVGCDSTWGAGVCIKPLTLGVNFVMHSLTKYICGHADGLMGAVVADNAEHFALLDRGRRALGISVSADDCYMMLRGLRTLLTRLRQHQESTAWLIKKLQGEKKVKEILYPAIKGSVGHEFWQRDFNGATGVFSIIIEALAKNKLADFVDKMDIFKMGYSWGGFESLIVPHFPNRAITPWQKSGEVEDATTPTLMRLQIGLEDKEDIWADLAAGFKRGYDEK